MRLTALCVCGTLLAFSSLSWTTADSDDERDLLLLGDNGSGPCTVTLRPEGPCRQSQDESTCPYLFSLPPLTVHLPKELRELEKIVEDLQQLKDNVDELRKMCADCTVSQTERECAKQREHDKLNEGTDRHKDERNWMNERKDFSKECWTDRVKAEKTTEGDSDTDFEKRHFLEEKERKKWETEREGNKGVIKGNEYEETSQEVEEKDGKTQTEGAKGKDKVGQANVPTASGDDRIVDMVRKKIIEKNNRDRQTDKNRKKDGNGNSKVDEGDVLENEKERKITSNLKNEKKTDESDHHVWRDETTEGEKNTQTEADRGGDGIKMSEDHDEHTNKEREQHREERKKEMEKRIKVERNNENTKQTESIGRTEKEKTIKEGEVEEEEKDRETGKEIKTEGEKAVQSVQRDSDGELTSSKAIERTDFVSINPTLHSTISLAPRHDSLDSNEAITLTSSIPSPPLSSSTSYLITGVKKGTTTSADGPTQSTGLGAADISEHPSPDAEAGFRTTATATINTLGGPEQQITSSADRFTSITSARPGAGLQGRVSSTTPTTTPHQNLYTTTFPGVADRSHWTAKKNISSNVKTGVKPPRGRGPNGEKRKPAIKPEADRKLKNPENDRKPHQAPSPDKKTKNNQKQKPSHQKPTTNQKSKPGKDPKRVQIQKPDQRPLSHNLPTDQNLKNIQIPKHDQDHTTDQNQQPVQKQKSHPKLIQPVQRPTAPHQRPQAGNVTGSDKDLLTDREAESVEIPIIDQNSKPEKHPVPPFKTVKPDQKQKPESEEKPKPDHKSTVNQHVTSVEEPELDRGETTGLTPKSNQKPETELMENSEEKLLSEPKSVQDSSPRLTPDHSLIKPSQETPKINQKPKPGQTPKPNQKHPELPTKPNVKHKPGQTPKHPEVATGQNVKSQPDQTPNQKYPGLTTSQHVKPKPDQTPDQKHLEVTTGQNVRTKPDQTPNQKHPGLTTSQHVKPKADQTPDQKYLEVTTGQNVKPLPDHEPKDPGRTTGQNVKTKPDQTPNQKQPGLKTGQNVKTKPDQTPNQKQPGLTTGQNVKTKPDQTPKHPEVATGQNVKPQPDQTPNQNYPGLTTSQHVKPKPDQTPDQKHLEVTTGQNVRTKPDQTPDQKHPGLTTSQHIKPKADQTPDQKYLEVTTGQNVNTKTDQTPDQIRPEPATGQNVKPKPDQTPDQKHLEVTTGQNVRTKPDQTPNQKHPGLTTSQHVKPKADQTPDQKYLEVTTGQNVKPLPDQTPNQKQPGLTTGQNVKTKSDQTPNQKQPGLTTGQNVKTKPDQTPNQKQPGLTTGQNVNTKTDQTPDQIRPEPATGQNVKPKPDQTPDQKHLEVTTGQNVRTKPDQTPNQKHPGLTTSQHVKPKADQTPDQKYLEVTTGQNVKPLPDQTPNQKQPGLTTGQNVKTKSDQTPNQKQPGLTTGQNVKTKPDQTPNQKQPGLTTGQNVNTKTDQTPDQIRPEPATGQNVKPKPNQTPKHPELTMGQNVEPKPDQTLDQKHPEVATSQYVKPKSDQTLDQKHLELTTGQNIKPKPDTTPHQHHPELQTGQNVKPLPDQTPKRPELATGQKTEPDQTSNQKHPELATGQKTEPDLTLNQNHPGLTTGQNVKPLPDQIPRHPEPATGQNVKPLPDQTPKHPELTPGQNVKPLPDQTPKHPELVTGQNVKPKPDQTPDQTHSEVATGQDLKPKPDQTLQANQGLKTPQPDEMPDLNPKSVPDEILEAESKNTSNSRPLARHRPPTRPTVKPGATSVQRPKPSIQLKPSPKTKTDLDPPQISRTTSDSIQNSQTDMPPTSGLVKQTADMTHSPGDTEFSPSEMKTITLDPKTSNSLETGPFPRLHALPESFTMSPHSRITSDLRPQTAGQPPSIPITTRPNKIMREIFPSVTPRTSPGSTKPNAASNTESRLQAKTLHNVEETAPRQTQDKDKMMIPVPSPHAQTTSTTSPDLRSTASATSCPDRMAPEVSTPSARELRVKINQVAAFFNNSLSPNGRLPDRGPIEHPEDNQGGSRPDRMDSKLPTRIPPKVTVARRDCSDYLLRGVTKSGVYLVTPDLRSRSFPVFCDMELDGGGWTLLQHRQDGSVSFNRTWTEYRSGFGDLDGGEFWLGNNMIHLLTRDRDMMLRVELEDFDGVMEYAEYEQFRVAGERLRYRLTVGGYSGTAGDALRFSKTYDHNNRQFTTPDRDNDRYPSGNCGAYYSSGWWFDACMAANLNGRYYEGKYKGVRDGIFWGTWHNISTEYYPTNDRQSFKRVRMMIRPKGFTQ